MAIESSGGSVRERVAPLHHSPQVAGMPLLEREAELNELRTLLDDVEAGGLIALVSGEAGIGKTALVEVFTNAVGRVAQVERVLVGTCDALFTPRPLGPLLDMARQAGGRLAAAVDGDRERLFGAFLDLLNARESTVAVFEDVHWADEATLDLLRYTGRRIRGTRTLLVLTFRDDEVGPSHPLRPTLSSLPHDAVRRIPLRRLSAEAVSDLARAAHRPDTGLHKATNGNPFFVTEVLAGDGWSIPASVSDAVLARAAKLETAARHTLDLVSIVPGRTEARLIEAVIGGTAAVVACRDAGMLQSAGGVVSFRHELARRAWEDSLEDGYARHLHGRVVNALLGMESDIDPARVVHHAGRAGDIPTVLRNAPDAARAAARVGAHIQAAALYGEAADHAAALPPRERAELFSALAWELNLIGRIDEATEWQERALEVWKDLDDPLRVGDALRLLSRFAWFRGDRAAVWTHGDEAIAVLEPLGHTPELAMAYSSRSQIHMVVEERGPAIEWGERAIAMSRKLNRTDILIHALNNVGTSMLHGEDARGRDLLEESLRLALEHGRQEDAGRAWINLAETASQRRDFATSDAWLEPGLKYCQDHDLDSYALCLLGDRSWNLLVRGNWSAAITDAETVLSHPFAPAVDRIPALATIGRIRARRGDPDVSGPLDEAWTLATETSEICRLWPAGAARLEAAFLNRLDDEIERGRFVLDLALRVGNRWAAGEIAWWLDRLDALDAVPDGLADPYALALAGDLYGAAAAFDRLGASFERALILARGSESDVREAFDIIAGFAARATLDVLGREQRERGVRGLPRGPSRATRRNPALLTPRQVEVLELLSRGLSNADIAESLFISPKTAAHHVSAVLGKLEASSRGEAAARARDMGLLARK
jgi:DNA-binding CsgD family transcriptional regulator